MEYPNYYFEEKGPGQLPEKEKKRGIGGYIVTAVVFTLIGAMFATILMPAGGAIGRAGTPSASATPSQGGIIPWATPTPRPTLDLPGGADVPLLTPDPGTYEMPELDGSAPTIGDSTNPIPDIVEQISEGVVGIINYSASERYRNEYIEQGSGSGFVISSEGYILTNAHVVNDASKLGVMFVDGKEYDAKLIGFDTTSDLAVLKVERRDLFPLKLGNSETIRVGEFVITIGDPTGRELAGTTTFGIVSATARSVNIDGQTNTYIQTDAAVNPGNSGGPLINMAGEVVGVTSAKTVTASYDEYGNAISAEGLGFALPINDVMTVVSQLITEGGIKRPGIGISVVDWNEQYAREYETVTGVLVYSVTLDGPGDKAGLLPNDIVVAVNGAEGLSQTEFIELVRSMSVGDSISLKVWRAGEYFETELELADLNSLSGELKGDIADYNFFGE